jgi:Na+/H+-translocating membrane pyrophosphatase
MGNYSVVIPMIFIGIAEMVSFLVGGVYGVAIAAVGMLSIMAWLLQQTLTGNH